ncbi:MULTISPECIES: hypothetical protein [unclassified Streptomyces]|uniref:hypothetical protein n=1 Tax=unclassified Streptomyces TaxID=2593676 RepID=UPI0023662BB2|nr:MULTISPECIES: hypothetical protein [unclassified Streptomyces]MDF3141596.1 hypothetical protein [Streptomyces sp. T21Q-yed]WDF38389.1 hypothetical protein PBV52_17085 [Streptomyces sp. T12]
MPRYVHVPTEATHQLIRQAYEAGGPYQWAREAWKNSEESHASIIQFGIEEQAAEKHGVLRRTIMDNGEGMEPDDLKIFLTTFGGGGKPIGMDQNFGQGFKSAVLPWNPYGVVVISYTLNNPDGAMLWIYRDDQGNYALKEWAAQDEAGDFVSYLSTPRPFKDVEHDCDWGAIRPDWMDTGTIMVLLGQSAESSTWQGDPEPSRNENVDGLIRYLNGRLLDVPERNGSPIETTVFDLYERKSAERRASKDKTVVLPSGREMVWRPRRIYGLRHFIPHTELTGTVEVDEHGTKAEWFYVPEPEDPVKGSRDYVNQRPVVAVDYQGELYHADSSKSRYRQFGITDEIRGRTWLVMHPPVYSDSRPMEWGVLTQASRNMLMAKGGVDLPWDQWGDAFFARFPEELARVRDEARSGNRGQTDSSMAKNLSRILDRLNPRFKASRILSSAAGLVMGFSSGTTAGIPGGQRTTSNSGGRGAAGGAGGSTGSQQVLVPAVGGTASGRSARTRGGFPAFDWKKFEPDEAKYLARYDQNDTMTLSDGLVSHGVVFLNEAHPVFIQECNYWVDSVWPKADPKLVQELVHRVYGEEAVAHVVHAQRLNGTVVANTGGKPTVISEEDVEQFLEPVALSSALLGLVNVEQRILTQGGGLFGSRANAQ